MGGAGPAPSARRKQRHCGLSLPWWKPRWVLWCSHLFSHACHSYPAQVADSAHDASQVWMDSVTNGTFSSPGPLLASRQHPRGSTSSKDLTGGPTLGGTPMGGSVVGGVAVGGPAVGAATVGGV